MDRLGGRTLALGEPIGRPLTATEVAPFVGSWTLDRDASVDQTLAAASTSITQESRRAELQKSAASLMAKTTFALTVAPTGSASVVRTGWRTAETPSHLVRDGGWQVLVHKEVRPAKWEYERAEELERRWRVERRGDVLVLDDVASIEALVLRRTR